MQDNNNDDSDNDSDNDNDNNNDNVNYNDKHNVPIVLGLSTMHVASAAGWQSTNLPTVAGT